MSKIIKRVGVLVIVVSIVYGVLYVSSIRDHNLFKGYDECIELSKINYLPFSEAMQQCLEK
jgi:hypothetical protein